MCIPGAGGRKKAAALLQAWGELSPAKAGGSNRERKSREGIIIMSRLYEEVKAAIAKRVDKVGVTKFLQSGGFHRNTWYNVIGHGKQTSAATFLAWLERVGGQISFSDDGHAAMIREICFVDAEIVKAGKDLPPPEAENYFAVPLVDEVGAGPGYLPQEKLKNWLLVYKWQKSIYHRSDLIAVELAADAHSMEPTLCPGDIVLVDRKELEVSQNGKMWLVLDPDDGSGRIKRVNFKFMEKEKDFRLIFYSDNPEYPPEVYSLKTHFEGSWHKAIAGRVLWAWSDVSNK